MPVISRHFCVQKHLRNEGCIISRLRNLLKFSLERLKLENTACLFLNEFIRKIAEQYKTTALPFDWQGCCFIIFLKY